MKHQSRCLVLRRRDSTDWISSNNPDVRVPLMMTPVFNPLPPTRLTSRRHQWLSVMARRKADVTPEQAQASLAVTYQQIRQMEAEQLSASNSSFNRERFLSGRIAALPGDQGLRHLQTELKTSLLLLFGATCAVLLILCANLANLMMARATVRAQETAVRLALGAGRLRLLRQWLTEGVVLAAIGGAVGIFIALWIKAGLIAFIPPDFKQNLSASFDWRLYAFILVVSLVLGLAFSLAPAIQAARQVFAPGLRSRISQFHFRRQAVEFAQRFDPGPGRTLAAAVGQCRFITQDTSEPSLTRHRFRKRERAARERESRTQRLYKRALDRFLR